MTIRATSAADTSKSAAATVTHVPVAVAITPGTASVMGGETKQFTATVTGHTNTAVTWSVTGGGTISSTGLYTPPAVISQQTTVTVTATSAFDNTKQASANVTLIPVSIAMAPPTTTLDGGGHVQLTATVSGHVNTAVTWSTSGPGTISDTGYYTAPAFVSSLATVTVTATSVADTSKSASATITINPVAVAVSAKTATLYVSRSQQFHANVTGTGNLGVTWGVAGTTCVGSACGTIDEQGVYTAPAAVSPIALTKVLHANTGPWMTSASLNAAYPYGSWQTSPVVFGASDGISVTSGSKLTVAYDSGLWCSGTYVSVATCRDADGYSDYPLNATQGPYGHFAPSKYMDPVNYPIHAWEMVGTFADSSGTIVGSPFVIGTGPVTLTAPNGATQLQLGANSQAYVDARDFYDPLKARVSQAEMVVTVVATSIVDATKSDTATVIVRGESVTVSPDPAQVNVGHTQQFTIEEGQDVIWSVAGKGCSGDDCGTITNSGLYTAPPAVPDPPVVKVIATSVTDPTRADAARVIIVNNPNLKFNGTYAFNYAGYDGAGNPVYMIGSFIADGDGNLNYGLIDINGSSAGTRVQGVMFDGTYQMNVNDNRGQMTFNLPSSNLTFRFALNSTLGTGHMIRFENSGQYGHGEFRIVDRADLGPSAFQGDYVIAMFGSSISGERDALVGRLHADGAGVISQGQVDIAEIGEPPTSATFTGSAAMLPNQIFFGRGTLTVNTGDAIMEFAYYQVRSDELYLMSNYAAGEAAPLLIGRLVRQSGGPFSNASLAGNFIFYGAGITGSPARPAVMVGRYQAQGNGVAHGQYTRNWGGTIALSESFNMDYTVAANGRAQWGSTPMFPYIAYLVAPNKGYFIESGTPGTTAIFGFFEPQSAGPFDNSTLQGDYVDNVFAATTTDVPYGIGVGHYGGNGTVTAIADYSNRNGNSADAPSSGTYSISDSTTGVGTLISNPGSFHLSFYIVSPDKFVYIPVDATFTVPPIQVVQK